MVCFTRISDVLLSRETAGARKSLDAIEGRRYQRHSVQVYKADNPANPVLAWTYTAIESERRKGMNYLNGVCTSHTPWPP